MKRYGIILFLGTLAIGVAVASCFSSGRFHESLLDLRPSFVGTKGSGHSITESRKVSDFHGIKVSGVFKVLVTAQKDFAVDVTADDNLVPLIQTQVVDGILTIDSDGKISSRSDVLIQVSAPNIDSVDTSGVSNVDIADLSSPSLTIDSSGASKLHIIGETERLDADLSGATKVDAAGLKTGSASIDTSGAARIDLDVTQQLQADASGASRITYISAPASLKKSTSGAATVAQR